MDLFAQEQTMNPLWRKRCVLGCGTQTPACPDCPKGQECTVVPMTCDECQKTICVPSRGSSSSDTKGSGDKGSNIGAIAGGAVAGIVVIAALVYCVWRFCIKPKRQAMPQDIWMDNNSVLSSEKARSQRHDNRLSTHTVGSVASSTMTRASNIIPIAYIPGVTNRGSTPSTPGLMVPPVPAIPATHRSTSESEHFFTPRDLRDSTMSVGTTVTGYGRASVASTIYGKSAVVAPVPAQTAQRGKAAMVSVVPRNGGPEMAPPVPDLDYDKYAMAGGMPSPAFSMGSTFLTNANTAIQTKPSLVELATTKHHSDAGSDSGSTSTVRPSADPARGPSPFADPLPYSPVSAQSLRSQMTPIPNLPELDTPRSERDFIPNLPELDTAKHAPRKSTRSRQSARIPDLPELDTPESSSIRSGQTPFGDEHEIQSGR